MFQQKEKETNSGFQVRDSLPLFSSSTTVVVSPSVHRGSCSHSSLFLLRNCSTEARTNPLTKPVPFPSNEKTATGGQKAPTRFSSPLSTSRLPFSFGERGGGGCLWNDVAQQALRLSLNSLSLSLSLSLSPLLFSRALSRIKIGAGRFSKKLCRIHISLIWRSLFFSAPLVFCFLSKNRISRFPRCALATLSAAGDLVSPRGGGSVSIFF